MSEQCLLYLHMEQRVRCFLFLTPILTGNRFDVKNSVALETDVEVSKLETEFRHVEEVLSVSLQFWVEIYKNMFFFQMVILV